MAEFAVAVAAGVAAVLSLLLTAYVVILRKRAVRADSFPCRLRVTQGRVHGMSRLWQGRRFRAHWVHDVIVVRRSWTPWTVALPVRFPEGDLQTSSSAGSSAGPAPEEGEILVRLRLDDGAVVTVTAQAGSRDDLAGPFLAAAVRGMPPGVSKRRPG